MTDPIADMLTRIRNAQMAKKRDVSIPFSNIKFALANILKEEGFVASVEKKKIKFDELKIQLKYKGKEPVIKHMKRISKPSKRIYTSYDKVPVVLNGYGMTIISTSKGLMTNKKARKEKMGGEVMCEIY